MNKMITIPQAEYKRLLEAEEDLKDIQQASEILRQIETGQTECVPSEFVERMLEGEGILKLWREHRNLTQQALSDKSGVNRVQIADIEAKRKTGSVQTLKKLANALGLTVDDLI